MTESVIENWLHRKRYGCVSSYGTDTAARNAYDKAGHKADAGDLVSLLPQPPAPRGLKGPVVLPSHFGGWLDFGVGGSIVVAIDNYGIIPRMLLLSHQLYVKTANEMLDSMPGSIGLYVLHVETGGDWLRIPAATIRAWQTETA